MIKPAYEDLYEALKDLNATLPCGFIVNTYWNKSGEPRAYVELISGVFDDLGKVTDMIESVLPKYSVCVISRNKVYLNLSDLKYRLKFEAGRKKYDKN